MSFISGRLVRFGSENAVEVDGGATPFPLPADRGAQSAEDGARILLGIRPEHIVRANGSSPPEGMVRIDVTIELLQPTGSRTFATFRLGAASALAELQVHDISHPGETITLDINLNRASLFDAATERAL